MDRRASYNTTLLGFLLLSAVVHLLLLFLFQDRSLFPVVTEPKRVYVEVREPVRSRELDLPTQEAQKRETPAKRLGPVDREAPKEAAPKGEAPDEVVPQPAAKPSRPSPPPVRREPVREPKKPEVEVEPRRPIVRRGEGPIAAETPKAQAPEAPSPTRTPQPTVPDITRLTQLAPDTVARLQQERKRKYRPEVERGDAVWLDTEQDLLFSFFKRLRDNIYLVWQYPEVAKQNRIEGTCLLEMVINRDGTVSAVRVLESSGSKALDDEAMEAVWKGAPYGNLPRVYEKDQIRILANFVYTIRNRIIY